MTFSLDAIEGTGKTVIIQGRIGRIGRIVILPASARAELNGFCATIFYGKCKIDIDKVYFPIDGDAELRVIIRLHTWQSGDVVEWEASPGCLIFTNKTRL